MGEKTLNIRIKNKYDTEANWTKNNPVLLAGETAYSSDKSGKYKIGDGTHKWSELSYAKADLVKSDVTTALGYTPPTNNTWRGVQNNLTSTATDQSLSAAQGKILNELTFQKKKTIDATVDWDTLKEFGCYKIQMASWGDAATKHSPNAYGNVYQFGLLLVFRGYDADTENRTVQIYIPYNTDVKVSSVVLIRMLNGTGWQAWHPIARGTGWSDIINKPTTFTPSSHTHDDRYYTETEMNSKLAGYLPISGGTLTGNLNLKPASGEGGEIHLDASTANRTENGIILDQQGGNFRIFGVPSADGTTKTGSGTPLVINPYSKTITGGYTLTGALSGNASSATALTSSAGSATQPVYFSGGKPVACSYTLGKSVPADALFTDHTYGNMKGATSSSAGSAGLVPAPNIGEQLKFLRADGAWVIPTNTTYSVGTSSYLGITKLYTETGSATDGTMTQNAITSALNGKSPTSHTHNYAGSSSSGGAATSANKLSTPRKIGNASFDGTADITLSQMGLNVPVEITKANYLAKKKAGTLNANTYYNVIDEYDSANVINDSSVTANSAFSSTKSEKTYAKKSTLVNTTLTASKWTGSSAPYSYVLSVSGVTSSNIVEIDYASNASSAAIEAYQNAMLADGGQTTNQITIKATEKPTVDIPITIVIRNDL